MKYVIESIREIDEEIVSIDESKLYLRVTGDHDDALITNLLKTSISYVENYIGKEILYKEKVAEISDFPREFEILSANIREIIEVKEIESGSILVEGEDYILRLPKILIKKAKISPLSIRFISGFKEIPSSIKHGIFVYLSLLYDKEILNSESLETVHILLKQYRNLRLV
jgi:hypothetical protein